MTTHAENAFDTLKDVICFGDIVQYKDVEYLVNNLMQNNLTQNPSTGEWEPTVRYTLYPQTHLVFYRPCNEFRDKFVFVRNLYSKN